jgi:WD40 repeat protein
MLYNLASGTSQPLAPTDDEVFAVEYSPDGRLIACGDRKGQVTVCDRASGQVVAKHEAHAPHIYDVEMSPDGRLLATCGADSTIKLWPVQADGRLLPPQTLRGHVGYVCSLAFSPDGTRLVSSCGDKTLKIWDPKDGANLGTLYGHFDYAASVEIPADGLAIYSGGFDGEIRFWEAPPLSAFHR